MKKDEWKDGAERWIPATERLTMQNRNELKAKKAKQADHVSNFNKICPVCGFYVDAHSSLCPGCMTRV